MQVNRLNNGVQSQRNNQQNNSPNFSGGFLNSAIDKASPYLQKLDADPIKAVIVLDVLTAIAPNTIIDTFKRNAAQGFETFRRESSGLIINCIMPGVAVIGAAWALKNHIMGDEFKHLPTHEIWANEDTINQSAATWKSLEGKHSKMEDRVSAFVKERFNLVQADAKSKMLNGGLTEKEHEAMTKAIDSLADAINKPSAEEGKGFFRGIKKAVFGDYKTNVVIDNKKLNSIYESLAKSYGSSKGVQIKKVGSDHIYTTSMKNYIRDTFAMARAFSDKSVTHQNIDGFTTKLNSLLKNKSRVTMAGIGVLALSMHYINRKMTERMTGRKGYSGYKDLDGPAPVPENKAKFAMSKVLGSAWFGAMAIFSMGKPSTSMLNFAAPTTTMDQARLLSLTTDVGRVNAACDSNEIKDTLMRDTLIFGHLYVLGDFIHRGVVGGIQKHYKNKHGVNLNLMNESPAPTGGNPLKWLTHKLRGKSVKTIEEIEGTIHEGKSSMKPEDIKLLRKRIVSGGSMASLAYSLVALGILAPITIAKITNSNRQKQLAAARKKAPVASTPVPAAVAPTSIVAVGVADKVKAPKSRPVSARAPKFYSSSQG